LENLHVPLDLHTAGAHLGDSGSYLLILESKNSNVLSVGSLGHLHFTRGYYVYVGSAMKGLSGRLRRHRLQNKRVRWHIDYLLPHVSAIKQLPIRSTFRLECLVSSEMARIAQGCVRGFGCTDCSCSSHLYYFEENPFSMRSFLHLIHSFRHRRALFGPGVS
jgi:sugar fermentation stimulation protein A